MEREGAVRQKMPLEQHIESIQEFVDELVSEFQVNFESLQGESLGEENAEQANDPMTIQLNAIQALGNMTGLLVDKLGEKLLPQPQEPASNSAVARQERLRKNKENLLRKWAEEGSDDTSDSDGDNDYQQAWRQSNP